MFNVPPLFGHPSDRKISVRHPVVYLLALVAWQDSFQSPVGSDVVAVEQPVTHSLLCLCKGEEEIHVEAFIAELLKPTHLRPADPGGPIAPVLERRL